MSNILKNQEPKYNSILKNDILTEEEEGIHTRIDDPEEKDLCESEVNKINT